MLLTRFTSRLAPVEWRIVMTVLLVQLAYINPLMHEGHRQYEQAESILVDGSLSIDEVLVRSNALDPSRRSADGFVPPPSVPQLGDRAGLKGDRSFYKGHYYPGVAPGLTFLYLPPLAVLFKAVSIWHQPLALPRDLFLGLVSLWLAFFVMLPITAATALCVHRVNQRLVGEGRSATLLTLMYAFATISFFYGTFVNAWQIVNLCTWVALLGLTRSGPVSRAAASFIGVASGVSVSMNYGSVFLAPLFGAWLLSRSGLKAVAFFGAGFAVAIAPVLIYHRVVFGNPLATAYAYRADQGIVDIMSHGFAGYGFPSLWVLVQLIASPLYGILFYMPILVLAFWARPFGRDNVSFWLGLTGVVLVLLLNGARRWDWWAGEGAFGPRYLVQALPFMWLLIVCGFKRVPAAFQIGFALLSAVVNWIGAQYGTNFLHAAVGQFLLRGHELPALVWMQRMLFKYTERRPPNGASGVIILESCALAFIWYGPQIVSFWKKHVFPPHLTENSNP
jgi:hypothetical protein